MAGLPSILTRLWEVAGANPQESSSDWNITFEKVGLILFAPPRNGGYWCTPTNSVAFATTGGDGVHYSWLAVPNDAVDFSPIVMTVPMCDTPNMVVGANLKEFLALGCRYGYFALEQLVYSRDETIRAIGSATFDPEASPQERKLLSWLAATFDLSPWADPDHRLRELERQYLRLAVIPPAPDAA